MEAGNGEGKGGGKVGASADTKRWRQALRAPLCRDRSPLPESIPTPYKRLRAPDERAHELELLESRREQQREGREKEWTRPPMRRTRTDTTVTAEELNKLFYERDILKDKLRRRNEELDELRRRNEELEAHQ